MATAQILLALREFRSVNCGVIRRALAVVLGAVCLGSPLMAQTDTIVREELEETGATDIGPALSLTRPDLFSSVDSATLIHGLPVLTLLDGRRFPISTELGRMGWAPFDVLPLAFLTSVEVQRVGSRPRYGSDGPGGVLNLRTNRFYTGGEVGFFYGRSDGKHGREDYSGYIMGGVGNDKFNVTVGAAYSESEVRVPHGRR